MEKNMKYSNFPILLICAWTTFNSIKIYAEEEGYLVREITIAQDLLIYAAGGKEKFVKELEQQASHGNSKAMLQLAYLYLKGDKIKQNTTIGFDYLTKAAQTHPIAQYSLGLLYEQGKFVKQDSTKACQQFKKSADSKYTSAQYMLSFCYYHGKGGVLKDYKKAFELLSEASRYVTDKELSMYGDKDTKGDVKIQERALHLVAKYLSQGIGTEKNVNGALNYFHYLADHLEFKESAHDLGNFYNDGRFGLTINPKLAFKYWKIAAEQGYARSQHNLGVAYYEGIGTNINKVEAEKWFKAAANQGDPIAKETLENFF